MIKEKLARRWTRFKGKYREEGIHFTDDANGDNSLFCLNSCFAIAEMVRLNASKTILPTGHLTTGRGALFLCAGGSRRVCSVEIYYGEARF